MAELAAVGCADAVEPSVGLGHLLVQAGRPRQQHGLPGSGGSGSGAGCRRGPG